MSAEPVRQYNIHEAKANLSRIIDDGDPAPVGPEHPPNQNDDG